MTSPDRSAPRAMTGEQEAALDRLFPTEPVTMTATQEGVDRALFALPLVGRIRKGGLSACRAYALTRAWAEIDALRARAETDTRDRERLDWLEEQRPDKIYFRERELAFRSESVRATIDMAIDAAMRPATERGEG